MNSSCLPLELQGEIERTFADIERKKSKIFFRNGEYRAEMAPVPAKTLTIPASQGHSLGERDDRFNA